MYYRFAIAAALLAGIASRANAEEPGEFSKGTWTFTAYGSFTHSFVGEPAKMGAATVGGGYYFTDNMSLNAELSGYYNAQHGPDAIITAGDLLLRHHLVHSGRFSLFLDAGAGVSYANHATPYFGTWYNYILETGVGATYQLRDNVHLIGGVRYFHLSNAHLEGPDRNPSINGIQGYVGLLFKI